MPSKTELWFNTFKPNPQAKLRLFCFPYAGGGSSAFVEWPAHLGRDIEVIGVQPPGRGNRFMETPIASLRRMVSELAESIAPLLGKPFAFFGHSNGALICFELARTLASRGLTGALRHIFISGNPAPQIRKFETVLHVLDDTQLREKLRELRGTPEEILQNADLLELLLPLLRADFAVAETHRFERGPLLASDLTLLGGRQDHAISREDLLAWAELFLGTVDTHMFDGGHFFIHEQRADVLGLLKRKLAQVSAHRDEVAYGEG